MGRVSLSPWLGDFLRQEILQVIAWKNALDAGIKSDPESPFSDDGSNFRSIVSESQAEKTHMVQLIEVLSVKDLVTVLLSDGERKIKARLSAHAVATLEAEIDDKLGVDVTGDVIQLKHFTVISTPYGPADGSVQLSVDAIEYEHHLRKTHGSPKPIGECEHIRRLIRNILDLRLTNSELADEVPQQSSHAVDQSPNVDRQPASSEEHAVVVPRSSLVTPMLDSQKSNGGHVIQSQYPPRPRSHDAYLAENGFTVKTGLNLDRPFQAGPDMSSSEHMSSDGARVLLNLLGQKRPREPSPPLLTRRPSQLSPEMISETQARPTVGAKDVEEVLDNKSSSTPQRMGSAAYVNDSNQPRTLIDMLLASTKSPSSAQPPVQESSVPSIAIAEVLYGRRKIPSSQLKLLEQRDSWIEPEVGQRFPHPNVPIVLLEKWNKAHLSKDSQKPASSQSKGKEQDSDSDSAMEVSGDDDSDSSDADVPELPWTPTPPRRPDFPPDSSFGSVARGTQQLDDLEVAAPRALPVRESPNRTGPAPKTHPLSPRPMSQEVPSILPQSAPRPSTRSYPHQRQTEILPQQSSPPEPQLQYENRGYSSCDHRSQRTPRNCESDVLHPSASQARGRYSSPVRRTTPQGLPPSSARSQGAPFDPHYRNQSRDHLQPFNTGYQYRPRDYRHPSPPPGSKQQRSFVRSSWQDQPMVGRRFGPRFNGDAEDLGPRENHSGSLSPKNGTVGRGSVSEGPSVYSDRPDSTGQYTSETVSAGTQQHARSFPRPAASQNPDDLYRRDRREYFQRGRRGAWLKKKYSPHASGAFDFQAVLRDYRGSHENDKDVTVPDFMGVMREVFPDAELTLSSTFTECTHPARERSLESSLSAIESDATSTPIVSYLLKTAMDESIEATSAGEQVGDQSKQRVPDDNGGEDIATETREQRKGEEREARETEDGDKARSRNPGSAGDFYRNWLDIRPRGAWVNSQPKSVRRLVNVLDWDI